MRKLKQFGVARRPIAVDAAVGDGRIDRWAGVRLWSKETQKQQYVTFDSFKATSTTCAVGEQSLFNIKVTHKRFFLPGKRVVIRVALECFGVLRDCARVTNKEAPATTRISSTTRKTTQQQRYTHGRLTHLHDNQAKDGADEKSAH